MGYSHHEKFLFCLSFEVGHCIILGYDILILLWQLSELIVAGRDNENQGIYVFSNTFKHMEDLFLFYMTINILLLIKIIYGVKVIMRGFKRYTNTNRVLTNLTYGTISFFYVAFSIV